MYYVLYTLVFVVADKLSTGEPDLLWYTRGTQIINVPALPQAKQSKENADKKKTCSSIVLFIWSQINLETTMKSQITSS